MSTVAENVESMVAALSATPTGVAEVVADPATADEVVTAVCDQLVSTGALLPTDLRRVAPSGDRWTSAEVAELILAPIDSLPHGRGWVVAVADAASMAVAAAAKLLRTIEEPPAPVWFVLCRDPDEAFERPVAGRITYTAAVRSEHGDARLAAALAAADVHDRYVALLTADTSGPPMAAAEAWAREAREVAKMLRPKPAGPWLRRIVRAGIAAWSAEAEAAVRANPADRATAIAAARFARAEVAARTAVGLFVPPEALLGPLLAARSGVQAAAAASTAART